MRPLKELLQILLDEVERNGVGNFGLCFSVSNLLMCEKINLKEHLQLKLIIRKELAKKGLSKTDHLFPKGETAPRIEFLKNEIEKL